MKTDKENHEMRSIQIDTQAAIENYLLSKLNNPAIEFSDNDIEIFSWVIQLIKIADKYDLDPLRTYKA